MRRASARLTIVDFMEFALSQLPEPPRRVLEVGCGHDGGVAPGLAAVGHDVLAIDPHAPEGPLYRRITLEDLDDPDPFDAVVAERVLEWRPYLYRWLEGPATESLEEGLIAAEAIRPIGFRWVGSRR